MLIRLNRLRRINKYQITRVKKLLLVLNRAINKLYFSVEVNLEISHLKSLY